MMNGSSRRYDSDEPRPLAARQLFSFQNTAGGGGGGGAITHPFQIQDASTGGDEPEAKINVRYGTVMDLAPTGVGTDIAVTASCTVYLDVEVDIDGEVIAATLMVEEGAQPADEDYHGYITLGTVEVEDGAITAINQAATHSLRMAMCGREVDGESLVTAGTYEFWGF
jgi:hypothetical protein